MNRELYIKFPIILRGIKRESIVLWQGQPWGPTLSRIHLLAATAAWLWGPPIKKTFLTEQKTWVRNSQLSLTLDEY